MKPRAEISIPPKNDCHNTTVDLADEVLMENFTLKSDEKFIGSILKGKQRQQQLRLFVRGAA